MVVAFVILIGGCSGFDTVPDDRADEAFVELDVEPEHADVYIDGDYRGTADGWHHGMIPVEPGHRRLKLEADGHVAQRFDVDVDEGRTVTVRVRLESEIAPPDQEEPEDGDDQAAPDDDEMTPPDHPAAPR